MSTTTKQSHIRAITPDELSKILKDHKLWLDTDEKEGCCANLQRVDLYRTDFMGADLRFAELQGANLSYANLEGVNLGYAELYGADLRFAKLMRSNLKGANFCRANLRGANLTGTDFTDTILTDAKVSVRRKIVDGKLVLVKIPTRPQPIKKSGIGESNSDVSAAPVLDVSAEIDAVFSVQGTLAKFDQATQHHILSKLITSLDASLVAPLDSRSNNR